MSHADKENLVIFGFLLIVFLLSAGDPDILDAIVSHMMKG